MKRLVAVLALLLLASCSRHFDWHEKITLHISTPDGPVVASSVQAMDVRYYPNGLFATATEVTDKLTGEAVVADLGDGRYLFALLGSGVAESAYADLAQGRPEIYRVVERQRGKPPRKVRRNAWPRLVSFNDIADPTSVFLVDPDDLAASFGPGYRLDGISIEITREPVTEGVVEGVLGPFSDYSEPRLCKTDGRTENIPLCMRLGNGDFIMRPR